MINKNKGLFSGVMSGILWGLDTALTGIILNMSIFIKVQKTILLAPFVSAFLHDMFSSLWIFLYIIATKQLKLVLKSLKTRSGKAICMAAILGGPVGMAAYLMAIKYIGAGYTASISAIYLALGSFWAYLFLKEKLNKKAFIGLILSIFSVIMLGYSPYNISNKNFLVEFVLALICVLGWSLSFILYVLIVWKIMK